MIAAEVSSDAFMAIEYFSCVYCVERKCFCTRERSQSSTFSGGRMAG